MTVKDRIERVREATKLTNGATVVGQPGAYAAKNFTEHYDHSDFRNPFDKWSDHTDTTRK